LRRIALASILCLLSAAAVALCLLDDAARADPFARPVAAVAAERVTTPPPPAGTRGAVAAHWAPTIYQETRNQRDLLAAFDFDGDWDGSNNAAHLSRYPLGALVYYTAVETPTHWLVTYVLYHPVDAKSLLGHDHDTEHVTLAVRKDGSQFGRLEFMETRFHKWLYQYAPEGVSVGKGADGIDGPVHLDENGRPIVYVQRVGHGVCGGFAPPRWADTFALSCHHREAPHLSRTGVVYRYTGTAEVPRGPNDRQVGYALVEIGDTMWRHVREVGPHATFSDAMDYAGERCHRFACPRRIGTKLAAARGHSSTGFPWEEGPGRGGRHRGDAFLDPALTLSRRVAFGAPFSTEYVFNPYLGVGRFDGPPGTLLASERPVGGNAVEETAGAALAAEKGAGVEHRGPARAASLR
jgi:hypothetical protein